jgi:hypothetical protein
MNNNEIQAGAAAQTPTGAEVTQSAQLAAIPLVAVCPIRVQRKRAKGYRMPENTKSVTRPGKFGNPYKIGMHNIFDIKDTTTGKTLKDYLIEKNGENKYHTVEDVLLAYRQKINGSQAMQRVVKHYLKGKNLACFCPLTDDKGKYVPCHADILLEIANG